MGAAAIDAWAAGCVTSHTTPELVKNTTTKYKSTWKPWSQANNTQRSDRWTGIRPEWVIRWTGKKTKKNKKGAMSKTIVGKDLSTKATSHTIKLQRNHYYPCTYVEETTDKEGKKVKKTKKGIKLNSLECGVWGYNTYNTRSYSKGSVKTLTFKKPKPPKVSISFDSTADKVSIRITSATSSVYERYDTVYAVYRMDTGITESPFKGKYKKITGLEGKNTDEVIKLSHTITQSNMPKGASVKIKVVAYCRGIHGDSKKTEKYFTYQQPAIAEITAIKVVTNKGKYLKTKAVGEAVDVQGQVLVYYTAADGATANYTLLRAVTEQSVKTSAAAINTATWTEVDSHDGAIVESATYKNKGKKKATAHKKYDAVMGESVADVRNAIGSTNQSGLIYGKRVWYRIVSEHQGLSQSSVAFEASQFFVPAPTMENDYAEFMHIRNGSDGESIDVVVGWDNPNGSVPEAFDQYKNKPGVKFTTIVSWSTYPDGWESTEDPSYKTIDWESTTAQHDVDKQDSLSKIVWNKSARLSIKRLTTGENYYLRTRRHLDLDDLSLDGPWSEAPEEYWPFTPTADPTSVTLNVPDYLVYGEPLSVSWYHDSVSRQLHWAIYRITLPAGTTEESAITNHMLLTEIQGKKGNIKKRYIQLLAGGDDQTDHTEISWEDLSKACPDVLRSDSTPGVDSIALCAAVSTGGDFVYSCAELMFNNQANKELSTYIGSEFLPIATVPDCAVYCPETCTQRPYKFYIFTNIAGANAVAICSCYGGISVEYPDHTFVQSNGEHVWSDYIDGGSFLPVANYSFEIYDEEVQRLSGLYDYVALVAIDTDVLLMDTASYSIEAYTISPIVDQVTSQYEMTAEEYEQNQGVVDGIAYKGAFTVNYAHQAEQPSYYSRVESRLDRKGNVIAEIFPVAPENAINTDTCSIYRVTPDGAQLIGENIPFGTSAIDRFPPFSKVANLRYALMTVTAEDDIATIEIPYYIKRHGLRFDWGDERSVELPYDIELSDSFDKDGEIRVHMDGSKTLLINPAVTREGSIKTKLVKLESPEQFELLRELAQYPGSALVRAHDGTCYEALVKINGIDNSYDSLVSPVTISTEEIDLSSKFKMNNDDMAQMTSVVDSTIYTEMFIDAYDASLNPSVLGWYEDTDAGMVLSSDTAVSVGKTYYIKESGNE